MLLLLQALLTALEQSTKKPLMLAEQSGRMQARPECNYTSSVCYCGLMAGMLYEPDDSAAHQVHDEVMLEGPRETATEAREHVVAAMANPWKNLIGFEGMPLRVELAVDANIADTWYEAK